MKKIFSFRQLLLTVLTVSAFASHASAQKAPAEMAVVDTLPALPLEVMQWLYLETEQVDFMFNPITITTNASGNDAKGTVTMFGTQRAVTLNCAKPLAGAIWTGKSGMLLDGQVYFANGCTYFEFTYKGKKYANQMTEQGFNYFNQIIAHFLEAQKKAQQGELPASGH